MDAQIKDDTKPLPNTSKYKNFQIPPELWEKLNQLNYAEKSDRSFMIELLNSFLNLDKLTLMKFDEQAIVLGLKRSDLLSELIKQTVKDN